jgi:xylan 1,4-beta-xylosidase
MTTPIHIDAMAPGQAYDPYWKRQICADRAGLTLRADFREHVAQTARDCGFQTIRQHGIFHDDMYIWFEREKPFNFQYLFSNYDFYLALGVRPFVELSFLPRWLASDDKTVFTAKCPACPPSDYKDWFTLVNTTVKALVARYGLDEVRSWHFEAWNEPNIPFWSGTQAQYFELYRVSVDAVKSVDPLLRIGGPATANYWLNDQGEYWPVWVEDFMAFCDKNGLTADFISTHPYPTTFPFDSNTKVQFPEAREREATFHDLTVLRRMVDGSPFAGAAIHANEWGTSPGVRDRTHDHVFSATFHCENLLRCLGLVDSLARWSLTDVSEESTPGPSELHGGWGIQTIHGLKKPDYHAYSFLNRCGGTLLYNSWEEGVAVFRDGSTWQILLYNHHPYAELRADWETIEGVERMIGEGSPRTVRLTLENLPSRVRIRRSRVDREHGWIQPAWQALGAPDFPDARQLAVLREAQDPDVSLTTALPAAGRLELVETVADLGMVLLEIERI